MTKVIVFTVLASVALFSAYTVGYNQGYYDWLKHLAEEVNRSERAYRMFKEYDKKRQEEEG